MHNIQCDRVQNTITGLYHDAKNDHLKMMKGVVRSVFRPIQPADFKDVYLSISKEQGTDLVRMIRENNSKHIVEFGTSFGISTLFLALGAIETGGSVITTELLKSKALKAIDNFKQAGVDEFIEVRQGDALETLKDYDTPIDLLVLDGWKDLYDPLFRMLEPNYHADTIIYVDNADMTESQLFLQTISHNSDYKVYYQYDGKVAIIRPV